MTYSLTSDCLHNRHWEISLGVCGSPHAFANHSLTSYRSAVTNDLSNGLQRDTSVFLFANFEIAAARALISYRERCVPPIDLHALLDILKRAVVLHERLIVAVDALDECQDMSNLLDELTKLANGRCRLFVTSRTLYATTHQRGFRGPPTYIYLESRRSGSYCLDQIMDRRLVQCTSIGTL